MENVICQIYKLLYIFHQKESPNRDSLLHASPTLKINIEKKHKTEYRVEIIIERDLEQVTGKGTNCRPDATNGFSWLLSIIFQSSCATRLSSWPSLSFFLTKYGNFVAMLFAR